MKFKLQAVHKGLFTNYVSDRREYLYICLQNYVIFLPKAIAVHVLVPLQLLMWYGNMFKQCDSNISICLQFFLIFHTCCTYNPGSRRVHTYIYIVVRTHGQPWLQVQLVWKIEKCERQIDRQNGNHVPAPWINPQEEIISRSRCIFFRNAVRNNFDQSAGEIHYIYCQTLCYSVPIFHLGIVRWIYQALYTVSVQLSRRDQGNRNPTYYHTNK